MNVIIATDIEGGFSKDGKIPWKSKEDMMHFKKITTGCVVILGRKTFESIGKPLPNRINIVISRNIIEGVITCTSYSHAMTVAKEHLIPIFIIGGLRLYQEALADIKELQSIYLTTIKSKYDCDLFIPPITYDCHKYIILNNDELTIEHIINYEAERGRDYNFSEIRYLALLKKIITEGVKKETRNGCTMSIFAPPDLRFNLLDGFPLLTTKKMFWRGIVEELIMFINGWTDATYLSAKGIHIWDGNTSAEFHKLRGLDYAPGDMGPMYGWNWRHFSAKYVGKDACYDGEGFDQLANLIDMINNNLTECSRRLLITTFDPSKIAESVLPPCHSLPLQFNVEDEFIDCKMTQRSADMFLGVPFNIASTALFMTLIGKVTGYHPRMLTMSFGDAHIYSEHIEASLIQCSRMPYKYCRLAINKELHDVVDLERLEFDDLELQNYVCHPAIKASMKI